MTQQSLGTLQISGKLPSDMSGTASNFSKTYRYTLTDQGFVRSGKLYKTFDPAVMVNCCGLVEASLKSFNIKVPTN